MLRGWDKREILKVLLFLSLIIHLMWWVSLLGNSSLLSFWLAYFIRLGFSNIKIVFKVKKDFLQAIQFFEHSNVEFSTTLSTKEIKSSCTDKDFKWVNHTPPPYPIPCTQNFKPHTPYTNLESHTPYPYHRQYPIQYTSYPILQTPNLKLKTPYPIYACPKLQTPYPKFQNLDSIAHIPNFISILHAPYFKP